LLQFLVSNLVVYYNMLYFKKNILWWHFQATKYVFNCRLKMWKMLGFLFRVLQGVVTIISGFLMLSQAMKGR